MSTPWGWATFTHRCHRLVGSSPCHMTTGQNEGEGEGSVGTPGSDGAQPCPRYGLRRQAEGSPGRPPRERRALEGTGDTVATLLRLVSDLFSHKEDFLLPFLNVFWVKSHTGF